MGDDGGAEGSRTAAASGDGESGGQGKDVAEQEALARDLGEELTDIFARFVRGEVEYSDLTFLTFETLQDLHIIASGAYELDYEDDDADDGIDSGYDEEDATDQQEELAQEPAGP